MGASLRANASNGQVARAGQPLQRQQLLAIIQDALAIIDDDEEEDFAPLAHPVRVTYQGDRQ